jgi:SAM-dependent methyltransferase
VIVSMFEADSWQRSARARLRGMPTRRALLATLSLHYSLLGQLRSTMFGNAEAYERFMGRWSRKVAPLLVDFAGIPGQSPKVLDIGSGTGALAASIAQKHSQAQVVGIDPAKEYVAYANSRNPAPTRVKFQIGDAQTMELPNASFDASLSLLVFNFIPIPAKALAEAFRVTKPNGRIAAAVWDYGSGMKMLRVFWDAAVAVDPSAETRDEKHMPLCRAGELSQLWQRAGLKEVQEQALDITTDFPSFNDFWDSFLLGQGPAGAYAKSLSDPRRTVLRDELKRRLVLTADNQPFSLPARVWAVRGTV